ncbi:sugar phosphate isomerase/epimerase family protein [Mariniblastus fucicola]|uniref:Xylose isomerase-like TIM barrel n=1 Tax=Mariniblastus fucicola TaxID=980251 RepID=A0A5B9PFI0_9BACT|nr:sugar phosphate isomerase/epimerase family protein [Mariniblastus fucicola]QEG24309.1 Xylose isomerase-like TIM barrel [Mariniblastus fucicola]
MLQLKKGLRLECLRQPFRQALQTAAQIGADAIEVNGRTEIKPRDMTRTAVRHLRKMLADYRLKISAVNFPTRAGYGSLDLLEQKIEGTKAAMTMAYELGCNVVVNDVGAIPDDRESPTWQTMTEALADIGFHGQRCGAWLAAKTSPNSGDGSRLKELIDFLPVQSLFVDFDPASFVLAEQSATGAMEILAEHVVNFRARDAVRDFSLGRGVEVELGRGSIDWAALLGTLEQKNYAGYITIDRDAESDPVSQCAQGLEYLSNLFE